MARRGKQQRDKTEPTKWPVGPRALSAEGIDFRQSWKPLGVFALFAILALAIYLPALQGSFIWDDDAHVTKPELRSSAGLYRIWFEVGATQQYYPLLHSAFWLQHKLWGDNPLGYHIANVLLHAACACLAWYVLRLLGVPGGWLAALIFLVHPVHVESVAWITEEKNTLSTLFYLSAMIAYLWFDDSRRLQPYFLALFLFVLGLLSKTVIATLPAALLVIFWWKRGTLSWQRDIRPLVPMFAIGAVAGLFTAWVERNLIGATGMEHDIPLLNRGLVAGRVVWFYLSKLFWPQQLTFLYPRWLVDPSVLWQWLFPAAAVAVTALLFAVRSRWRAPLATWLLFVGSLFPVLGFLNVYPFLFSFVANHFQYLASFAIIAFVSALAVVAIERYPGKWQWGGYAACLVVVGLLAVHTWQESAVYRDVVTLYQTTLKRNPQCWLAHNNLGFEFARQGRADDAIKQYNECLRLKSNYSVAHYNLANQLAALGKAPESIEHYRKALEIRPQYTEAMNNLGGALLRQGNLPEAIANFQSAIRLRSDFADAHSNLGIALMSSGRLADAEREFRRALELNPDLSSAQKGLGDALVGAGDWVAAASRYQQAVALQPSSADAHNSLGVALAKLGRVPEAISHFQTAATLATANASDVITAYANLTRAHAQAKHSSEAIATAEKAIEYARSKGDTKIAGEIEAWLVNYRKSAPADTPQKSVANPAATK